MTIALITPSRRRPALLKRMWESALKTATYPDQLRLHYGIHKEEEQAYGFAMMMCLKGSSQLVFVNDWSTVYSANYLAGQALTYEDTTLLMIIGDDAIFDTRGWDKALLDHYAALENKVHLYSLRDSRDENGTPHPIATKEWVLSMGYIATPIFLHWYVDTWMTQIARENRIFTHMKDYLLIHDKPSDHGQGDETHTRIRVRGWKQRDDFVDFTCHHFLDVESNRLRKILQYNSGDKEHVD